MPITVATAPPQSLAVLTSTVQNWIAHPTTAPQAAAAGISFVADGGVNVHLPHPVYNLGLDALLSGKGLSAATLVSWRYLLSDGETTAMAEIAQPAATHAQALSQAAGAPAFASLNRGPFVASLVEAVSAAESSPQLQAASYEVATLNIPALYVVALWLKTPTPGGGTVIPLAPAPAQVTAGQHYTETAFLEALTPAAHSAQTSGGAALA